MAEVTAMRNNALPYPIYGAPWTLTFPILDNTGQVVAGAAGLDSEVSLNGDTAADCTNEATQIATSTGEYYLTLTGAEMTADIVTGITKTSTTDAKPAAWALYPRKLITLRSGTSAAGAAGTITLDSGASAVDDFYNGCVIIATLDGSVEVRVIADYVGSTKVASVTPNWNTTPDADDTFVIKIPEGRHIQQILPVAPVHMGHYVVREDTASQEVIFGPLYTVATGEPYTGSIANTDIKVWKEGGTTEASKNSGGATHISEGRFYAVFDATDFDTAGKARATVSIAGVQQGYLTFDVLPTTAAAAVYDGTTLGVDVTKWNGTTVATPTVAGVPEIDVTHWNGTAVATPTVAGVPEIDVTHWNGTAVASPNTAGYPVVTVKDGTGTGEIDTSAGGVSISAASIRSAIGMASANLDTQLDALPTATENAAALLDLTDGVESGLTLRQAQRLFAAALAGVLSGAATSTILIKGAGIGTTRIQATVDADGNRSAVVLTP